MLTCDHVNPENFLHVGERAVCRACGKFLGYVRSGGGPKQRRALVDEKQDADPEPDDE
jgi:hypothetical protein